MKNKGLPWYKLDNAAKIFPGQNSSTWANVFRFTVELKEEIDPQKLQQALVDVLPRFPSFDVRIKPGFFWYFFEKNPKTPTVAPDIKNCCYRINFKENANFLFRVYYHANRISIDLYHAVTDGYGCSIFITTLTAQYLRLCGHEIPSGGFVLDLGEKPSKEETEDSYLKNASSSVSYNRRDKRVYHAVGTKMPEHNCNYTVGIMSFEQVHKICKSYGVTVTEFFAALLMDIHYQKQKREKKKQKEVCVQIPVNLRKFFSSKTLRNFVLCLRVKMNPNMGDYTFEELLKTVAYQLRLANDKHQVNSMMTQNLKIERNLFARAVPLFVKNIGVGLTFLLTGEQTTTALLSNVGPVPVPPQMKELVEKYILFTGPGKLNGARCGVISIGDRLAFSFSNCYAESDIEKEFFTRLVKMGIHVKIESNR